MEAVVVSMALKVVGTKLAPLLFEEYTSIAGVKRDLVELEGQVVEINGWMEKRYEAVWSGPSLNWLKRLKDVAYDVDDVVDEFQLKAEKHAAAAADGGIISKYMCTESKSFILQCKTASKIKKIKKRFAEIVKQRTDYNAVTTSISVDPPVRQTNMRTWGTSSYPDVDVSSVVGRDEDKKHIISKLLETDHQLNIKIISVIGLGGSGKTTLSQFIFNDGNIKKHFDFTLWIHVSQEFDVDNLVKKVFEAFGDNNPGQYDMPSMRKTIKDKLAGKKFLLVLDDVWTESNFEWDRFWEFLININAYGSRILLTTRSNKVAKIVRSTYSFKLPLLSDASSWQLFIESSRMATNDLTSEFVNVGKEIVDKCGGVPLAIKVLAGVLSGKQDINQWKAMRNSNLLYVEGEEHRVAACLRLSYFYLPSELNKQCFTICSVFPKGHKIDKEQLIDLWIAHDMITLESGVDYLEDVGDKHFNSLVQMSFLQNVKEKDGRVTCEMHDLVHDLSLSILGDEILTIVPEEAIGPTKAYRFFSLTEPRKLFPKKVFENSRAIFVDKGNDIISDSTLKNAKHLRSIIIENSILSTPMLMAIFKAKNLKYLDMSELHCEALPEAITDVWGLQVLHLVSSNLLKLTRSIGKLKRLRTLKLSWCSMLKSLPDSIGDCQMLSTLELNDFTALEELPSSIGRNKRLRVLILVSTGILRLPSGITTLENLEYLTIKRCFKLKEFPEGIGKLTNLKQLDLDDHIRLPAGIGQLTQLEKLNMFRVETDKKYARISELETLSSISGKLLIYFLGDLTDQSEARHACLKQKEKLHELELSWASQDDRKNPQHEIVALDGLEPPLGIKRITIRAYAGGQFASWLMLKQASGRAQGHGPFPLLTKMRLYDFPNLKHLDGLVQLPCLEELQLYRMHALESISGGPFPKLAKVTLEGLRSLGEVWIVTDGSLSGMDGEGCSNHNPHQLGQLQIGSCLTYLSIEECPKLVVKPHFPISLGTLWLNKCSNNLLVSACQSQGSSSSSNSPPSFSHLKVLQLWSMGELHLSGSQPLRLRLELLQHMSALESLEIVWCDDLIELPEYLGNLSSLKTIFIRNCSCLRGLPQSTGQLTSLQQLSILNCHEFVQFPESLRELRSLRMFSISDLPSLNCFPESLCHLTSLEVLDIGGCQALGELPECQGDLQNLRQFRIVQLHSMTCLPQFLCRLTTSLKEIEIVLCPRIKCLPHWIKGLTVLQKLKIYKCSDLERRCEKETGEDWHLISRIPNLQIGHRLLQGG